MGRGSDRRQRLGQEGARLTVGQGIRLRTRERHGFPSHCPAIVLARLACPLTSARPGSAIHPNAKSTAAFDALLIGDSRGIDSRNWWADESHLDSKRTQICGRRRVRLPASLVYLVINQCLIRKHRFRLCVAILARGFCSTWYSIRLIIRFASNDGARGECNEEGIAEYSCFDCVGRDCAGFGCGHGG